MVKSGIQRDKRSGRKLTFINMDLGQRTSIDVPYRHTVVIPKDSRWKKPRKKRFQDLSHLITVSADTAGFEIARK